VITVSPGAGPARVRIIPIRLGGRRAPRVRVVSGGHIWRLGPFTLVAP
jgi:hypothetical protein